jgi:hypothetical protein
MWRRIPTLINSPMPMRVPVADALTPSCFPLGGLLCLEAAGIEPASRRKQNPKQVALLPANALISQWIVPPLRPVSSRLVPFNSPLEGHTGGTCGPTGAICLDASGLSLRLPRFSGRWGYAANSLSLSASAWTASLPPHPPPCSGGGVLGSLSSVVNAPAQPSADTCYSHVPLCFTPPSR